MKHEIIQQSRDLWSQEPDKARASPVVRARSDGAQALVEAGSFSWYSDLPPVLGGENKAPSPTAALLGALAACAVVFVRDVLAPQFGIRVDAVEAEAKCQADFRGLLGMPEANPELQQLDLSITVHSPDGDDKVRDIEQAWLNRCPIYLALTKPNNVSVRFAKAE